MKRYEAIFNKIDEARKSVRRKKPNKRGQETELFKELEWDEVSDEKFAALAKFLGMTPNEADDAYENGEYDGDYSWDLSISHYGGEYMILTEQEADQKAYESVESLIDDVGLTMLNGWENYVNEKHLGNDLADNSNHAYEYGYDSPEDYLTGEEPEEEDGDWSEDQRSAAGETAQEQFASRVKEDPIGYLEEIYPEDMISKQLEPYVDIDKLINYVNNTNGRGNALSGYDGEENEERIGRTDYYIYRTN